MAPHALELFAGIGGESLALKASGIKTVAYCEIDPFCQAVLRSNIAQKRLDPGRILPDVTKVTAKDIPGGAVDMIAGGFPCKGLSSIGARKGMYGDSRSALVKHVYRLIDELRPAHVFLENTPLIARDKNYGKLINELRQRGYSIAFMVMSASQVGARHKRMRWFLLARQPDAAPLKITSAKVAALQQHFEQQVPLRLVPRNNSRGAHSCFVFGNAVCPAQAAEALRVLNEVLTQGPAELSQTSLRRASLLKPVLVGPAGQALQDTTYAVPDASCKGQGFNVEPPKPPAEGVRTKQKLASMPGGREGRFFSQCMPTPRTGGNCSTCGQTFTQRSQRDGGNFLLSAREMHGTRVPALAQRRKLQVSPEFLACHMGFPRTWINGALAEHTAPRPRSPREPWKAAA